MAGSTGASGFEGPRGEQGITGACLLVDYLYE